MTIFFFGLGGCFRGLGGLRFYFFQKITSEMDSACQKTYISTPLITENDNWLIGLRGRFRGLSGLILFFFLNNFKWIWHTKQHIYPNLTSQKMTIYFYGLQGHFSGLGGLRSKQDVILGVDNWYVKLHEKLQVSSYFHLGLALRSRLSKKKCQRFPPPL